ncbi:class I SAM-dependent methyltransferase [Desulfomonile tiedjei]|uniref:Methyltransferase family protein n=1 Tax=Desulfomonile tiedjei (strain ATCC 49306 / DSM 6799 / DCB-1) TaxID=706587 RepID=I4C2N3_DESTA|nr:class I SAM-dependent methyltransferase [Desulfomonile tiedjei]AFM23824.1 methyltransferase family protein [Desulfomonile tiedjei DSM 6799]
MEKHVCPWWIGYLLVNPIRRWLQNPDKILAPYVRDGMTVLDIGPGMGFFTIPASRLVGANGKVIAVDVQERMLTALQRRARNAGMAERIVTRVCRQDDIMVSEPIDVCLALHMVHEVPDPDRLFSQIKDILKPGGIVLLAEPRGHVSKEEFQTTLDVASAAGLKIIDEPEIRRSRSAVLAIN